jgi:hypothetical protein
MTAMLAAGQVKLADASIQFSIMLQVLERHSGRTNQNGARSFGALSVCVGLVEELQEAKMFILL